MIVLVPLCYHDGYFDILETKALVYRVMLLSGLSAFFSVKVFVYLFSDRKSKKDQNRRNQTKKNQTGKNQIEKVLNKNNRFGSGALQQHSALLLFLLSLLFSEISSRMYFGGAPGGGNWGVDVPMLFGSAVWVYMMRTASESVSKEAVNDSPGVLASESVLTDGIGAMSGIGVTFFLVNAVVFGIGLFQVFGVDVLGLHEGIRKGQYYDYLSTIGNTNWLSMYLAVTVTIFILEYIQSGQWSLLLVSGMGTILAVLSGSDSFYAGIGLAAFPITKIIFKEKGEAKRVERAALLVFLLSTLLWIISYTQIPERLSGISTILLSPSVNIPASIGSLCGFLLIRTRRRKSQEKHQREIQGKNHRKNQRKSQREKQGVDQSGNQRKNRGENRWFLLGYRLTMVLLLLLFSSVILWAVCTFDDSFGTGRGLIWRLSVEKYRSLPLFQKLFGIGQEGLGAFFDEFRPLFKRQLLCSHSELLDILLTRGIFGLLSGIYGIVILIRNRKPDISSEADIRFRKNFGIALTSYLGTMLLNSPTALHIAVLTVLFIL